MKALDDDPKLLVIRPAAPATSLDHFKPFKLSTALMAVHKDCYAPIGLIQQGGPRRRETKQLDTVVSSKSKLTRPIKKPKATWVEPTFVADIEYRDITSEGLLRASSFKGRSRK